VATRIFLKIIASVLCVLLVGVVAVDIFVSRIAESSYLEERQREIREKVRMLAILELDRTNPQTFDNLAHASGARVTVIARDGRVIYDSASNPAHMENHKDRPEFREALAGHAGRIIRHSPTLGVNFLYVAEPTPNGAIRLAVPLAEIERHVNAMRLRLVAASALCFLPAIVLAALFARSVSGKLGRIINYAGELAKGNFKARLNPSGGDELGGLTGKLNETARNLEQVIAQLHREQAELERVERIRKDFVINVSHELRTPLASIQGYTETLLSGALHDENHNTRFLTIIQQNAERLSHLIADIMALSRIEMKIQRFEFASYAVNSLIDSSVESLRPVAEKKNISVTLEHAPDGTEVFCDYEAVHQILGNLLDNGIKYTHEGGSLVVGARPTAVADQPSMVEIFVRDSGIGIPKEELPRLFERFYRVDKARSRDLGGTGLGLSIVKHLVRGQGGDVWVASDVGQGSTFSFTLPTDELGLQPPADFNHS
jgi:two-component system, OmpR family, phosphate regulon sensor histidine kinase PhoR